MFGSLDTASHCGIHRLKHLVPHSGSYHIEDLVTHLIDLNSCCCRYDGQTFVKPPEVLARDRLLGSYEVRSCTLCSTCSVLSCRGFWCNSLDC